MEDEDTIAIRSGEEFDLSKVEHYLRDHIEGLGEGSLQVRQFPSGASNLTYLVQVGDWEGVLRRPPFGPVPPKAHTYLVPANGTVALPKVSDTDALPMAANTSQVHTSDCLVA